MSVMRAACWLTLHADYITDYLLVCHMLCVRELWSGSPYITTNYSAHLLNLTHSGQQTAPFQGRVGDGAEANNFPSPILIRAVHPRPSGPSQQQYVSPCVTHFDKSSCRGTPTPSSSALLGITKLPRPLYLSHLTLLYC